MLFINFAPKSIDKMQNTLTHAKHLKTHAKHVKTHAKHLAKYIMLFAYECMLFVAKSIKDGCFLYAFCTKSNNVFWVCFLLNKIHAKHIMLFAAKLTKSMSEVFCML